MIHKKNEIGKIKLTKTIHKKSGIGKMRLMQMIHKKNEIGKSKSTKTRKIMKSKTIFLPSKHKDCLTHVVVATDCYSRLVLLHLK